MLLTLEFSENKILDYVRGNPGKDFYEIATELERQTGVHRLVIRDTIFRMLQNATLEEVDNIVATPEQAKELRR